MLQICQLTVVASSAAWRRKDCRDSRTASPVALPAR